jgi:hypothetical protein
LAGESPLFYRVLRALARGDERGITEIPPEFRDDGCTWWFDSLFGYDFTDLCRVHDWAYCSRCQPPNSMSPAVKREVDWVLSQDMRERLPWVLDWTAGAVYRAVYMWGDSAYDSCKLDAGDKCRHDMKPPPWMLNTPEPMRFLSHAGADL